jgi:2'-5' RNA ligase
VAAAGNPTQSVALALMQEAGTAEQQVDEEDWRRFQGIQRLADHWVRADWPSSRHYVTWYVVFRDPAVHAYAARFQRELADLDYLDPIPADGLHMTIQGVAYRDQLDDDQINAIARRGVERCAELAPFDLCLGPISGFRAGTFVRAEPWAPVKRLRERLRGAIADVLGADALAPDAAPFKPHMSITYCHADAPAAPLIERLARLRNDERVATTIHSVELLDLYRHDLAYHWTTIASVPLGAS